MPILETRDDKEQCPDCGSWYSRIATHWSKSDCQWPDINGHQMELLTGMLLGDGSMRVQRGYMRFQMTNKTFLEWLSQEIGWLCSDVTMQRTAAETAQRACEALGRDTQSEDCVDYYVCRTRTHPDLQRFTAWYDTGEIVFPQDLKLTPTSLKMWYVSDGGIHWGNDTHTRIEFGSQNESERPEAIISMLSECGFDVNHGDGSKSFYIPHRQIEQFFDYIGSPPPGFGYKFEYEDRERYDDLKAKMREQHCTQTLEYTNI